MGVARFMVQWVIALLLIMGRAGVGVPAAPQEPTHDFAAVDARALQTPASATTSISSLSAYLTADARDDREKARAIFRWITANIEYDTSREVGVIAPEIILAERRGVCYDYALLFEALAEAAGMKAELIIGHSKKFQPDAEQTGSWLNHAWNVVEIAGEWQLLDCCWGAGYLNEHRHFVRRFSPHYFLTPPDVFAYDHLPKHSRWQLREPPISKEQYLERVQVRPPFFDCGMSLVSHPWAVIETEKSVDVTIGAPDDILLIASLSRNGSELGGSYAFTQRGESGFVIHARFPSPGAYVLRVFARHKDGPGTEYAWALDYAVKAHSGERATDAFPKAYGSFMARNCRVDRALSRTLPAGRAAEFALTVPEAEDVIVATGGSYNHLRGEGARFAGNVPISPGPVVVYARFPGRRMYEGLLQYVGQ